MAKIKVIFQSAVGLMQVIQAVTEHNEKAVKEGKPKQELCIDFYAPVASLHETLAAYDILSFHQEIDISARIMASTSTNALAITSALPKENVYISKSAMVIPLTMEQMQEHTTSSIKIVMKANRVLVERVNAAIAASYDLPVAKLEEIQKEQTILQSDELIDAGLTLLTRGVNV